MATGRDLVLLALAANTSYGGLPVLLARLSSDSLLPHIFGLRADRQVYRQGILALSVVAGVLLVFSGGQVTTLVPLFAIGVFVGFTLSQAGMVRHWLREKGRGWQARLALAAIGATLTAAAALVITAEKFFDGAWLIVLIIPLLVLGFSAVHRGYDRIGEKIGTNTLPERPQRAGSAVIVPVTGMSRLTSECLTTALSMGREVVAVHVTFPDELGEAREILRKWHAWRPEVPLVLLESRRRELGPSIVDYVRSRDEERIIVLIGELRPHPRWQRVLTNHRGAVIARSVNRHTNAAVCRLHLKLTP
ncbi:hypothetical protein ACH347_32770 [Saccharopolyspora sp. 5N102]|uniref:hypothetical protein n=1 Tax=Saccharopolyspora sp. 5N102 TaxID=3375155 RepID=UPI0037AE7792